jgi:hypothetical protein
VTHELCLNLNDTGHLTLKAQWLLYAPPALTLQISTLSPHSVSVCSVWFSQYTATVSPNSINRLGFVVRGNVFPVSYGLNSYILFRRNSGQETSNLKKAQMGRELRAAIKKVGKALRNNISSASAEHTQHEFRACS